MQESQKPPVDGEEKKIPKIFYNIILRDYKDAIAACKKALCESVVFFERILDTNKHAVTGNFLQAVAMSTVVSVGIPLYAINLYRKSEVAQQLALTSEQLRKRKKRMRQRK